MGTYNIHEAKTHLSELIALAERGEDVVIARANKPAVKLVALTSTPTRRVAGLHRGAVSIADDFDDALPADFLITSMTIQPAAAK